ncbi:murein hydrolase activator EnvC family protein [Bacteroidota bacterium]
MMKAWTLILIICCLSDILLAQTKSELETRKNSTLQEIEMAKELLEKTTVQKQSSIQRLSILNRGIRSRESLIESIASEIEFIDTSIAKLEEEIYKLNLTIENGKKEYAEIIYSIYKNHTEEDKLMYLLASESLNQFYQRIKYMKYLKDYRERKTAELQDMTNQLEERTQELIQLRSGKSKLLYEKENENRELLYEREERNRMVSRLSQEERRIRNQIKEKERIRKELEKEIRRLIELEASKSASNTLITALTPEQKLLGSNFTQNKGRLPWPVERGIVTADFGAIPHPALPGVVINSNGIDITTNPGEKARAIFDGEVTSVFAILGANYAVIIMHGEYLSVYQNLVDLQVKAGDKVIAKQDIGTIHADDNVSVLHLQIWKSKEILNPKHWLSK